VGDEPTRDLRGRTATHASDATAPGAEPQDFTEPTLERYRIQERLGAGGMGVVFAAYDPDLERRVALKLLGQPQASRESRERLLREARAMARLTHTNVVTVYEVGTSNDRDYVAMELVDGTTLVEWLESKKPPPRQIIAAFLAAGRGLAAAHAAGIVHRDFKPANVFRRRDGHIQVGDFGIAVGVGEERAPTEPTAPDTPSSLDGLTETGSILGTPAYMAPEQWQRETVGPAADQFAFSVALWEALAGGHPYPGGVEEMRAAIMRGPAKLDSSKIPRKLRAALKRGLEPDPERRWPSMDALLGAIERSQRSLVRPLVLAGATCVVAAAIGIVLVRGARPTCGPPVLDPDRVWPSGMVLRLIATGKLEAATHLDHEMTAWRHERDVACHVDEPLRNRQLTCLDAVLSTFDAVAHVVETTDGPADATETIEAKVCARADPPRLQRTLSDATRQVIAFEAVNATTTDPPSAADVDRLLASSKGDPCAYARAAMNARFARTTPAARRDETAVAEAAAAQCGDDDLIASIAVYSAEDELEYGRTDELALARLDRVEPAVMRAPETGLLAELDIIRMREAAMAHQLDAAIARGQTAVEKFRESDNARSAANWGLYVERLRVARGDDPAGTRARLEELRRFGADRLGPTSDPIREIDSELATLQYWSGDVAGAHVAFERLHRQTPNPKPRRIVGRVVDADGHPVAGALVSAAAWLSGDALSASESFNGTDVRRTTTDAQGQFVLADAVDDGVIIAELGALHSTPTAIADRVDLAFAPTSRIEGKVELHGEDPATLGITATDLDLGIARIYGNEATIGRDGTFVLEGVRRGAQVRVKLFSVSDSPRAQTQVVNVTVDAPVVSGIALAANSSRRELHVVVRATVGDGLSGAQVKVFDGTVNAKTAAELRATTGTASASASAFALRPEIVPAPVKPLVRRGDIIATIEGVPLGPATACALATPKDGNGDAETRRKILANLDRIEVRCVAVAPTDTAIEIDVPPFPRF
jgi:hypothetical protein